MTLLALLGLSTWRVSSMLLNESGPADLFGRLRRALHTEEPGLIEPGSLRELFSCLWCFSVWVGLALYLGVRLFPRVAVPVLWILSASSVAIAVDKNVTRV